MNQYKYDPKQDELFLKWTVVLIIVILTPVLLLVFFDSINQFFTRHPDLFLYVVLVVTIPVSVAWLRSIFDLY